MGRGSLAGTIMIKFEDSLGQKSEVHHRYHNHHLPCLSKKMFDGLFIVTLIVGLPVNTSVWSVRSPMRFAYYLCREILSEPLRVVTEVFTCLYSI